MKMEMPVSKTYVEKFKKIQNYFDKLKNTYEHIMIYPYSSISTTMGNSFYVQNYLPMNKDSTHVSSTIYLPKTSFSQNKSMENFFSKTCTVFNKKIFD